MTEQNTELYIDMIQVFITNVSSISILKKFFMSTFFNKNLQDPNTSL